MPTVDVIYTKFDGSLHWHFTMIELLEDEHGLWLEGPPGTLYQRGEEPPVVNANGKVMLVPAHGDWTAFWNRRDDPVIYVDATDTPRRKQSLVTAVDLDLDVIAWRDGRVEIVDVDEFEDHQIVMSYPDEVVTGVMTTAEDVLRRVSNREAPFDETGDRVLTHAARAWTDLGDVTSSSTEGTPIA